MSVDMGNGPINYPGADEGWGEELKAMKEDLQHEEIERTRVLPPIASSAHPLEYDEDVERQRRYINFLASIGWVTTFAEVASVGSKLPGVESMSVHLPAHVSDIMEFIRRDLPRMDFKSTVRRRK